VTHEWTNINRSKPQKRAAEMTRTIGIIAAVTVCAAVTGQAQKEAKPETIRQQIARIEPAFEAEWLRVGKSGTLADFLKLKESEAAKKLVSLTPPRTVMDVCVDEGLGPWLSVAEAGARSIQGVPGGWVRLEMFLEFDVPGHERPVTYSVSALTVAPQLTTFSGEGYETSIVRGFKGPKKTPVSGAQITRTVWVNIPRVSGAKEMELTVSALTTGPKDGVVTTETVRSTVMVNIVANATPTRANLFSLWLRAVEAGQWLADYPNGDAGLKIQNRHYVDSVRGWFSQFAGDPQLAEAALVKELAANDRYVKFVGIPGGIRPIASAARTLPAANRTREP
jgi:hypothetical protein